jgi:muramoyltetrapeptide carboxypeptidase
MKIALIEPSSAASTAEVFRGLAVLHRLTGEPLPLPSPKRRSLFLAGSDGERFEELRAALEDPAVEAVMAVRGGAGAQRLLPHLGGIRPRGRKILVGSSDLTFLGLALWKRFRIPFCHGPMLVRLARPDFSRSEADFLKRALQKRDLAYAGVKDTWTVRPGRAEGVLVGGNLTLVCTLLGSRHLPPLEGSILFLEEVNEPLYRLDRLLQTLAQRGVLDEVRGVVFGRMEGCFAPFGRREWRRIVEHYFGAAPYPVLAGFPSGHGAPQYPLWIGGTARLDASRRSLQNCFPGNA